MLRFALDITAAPAEAAAISAGEREYGPLCEGGRALDAAEAAQRALRDLFAAGEPGRERDPLLERAASSACYQQRVVSQSFLKLLELLRAFAPDGLPRAGAELCVADLCALPGSMTAAAAFWAGRGTRVNWCQLSLAPAAGGSPDPHRFATCERSAPRCYVGGAFPGDVGSILDSATRAEFERRRRALHGRGADLVIADGFPNLASRGFPRAGPMTPEQARAAAHYYRAGQQQAQIAIVAAEVCAGFAAMAPGAAFVAKLLDFYTEPAWYGLVERLRACFGAAHLAKPLASAPSNSEVYFVGLGFAAAPADLAWAAQLPEQCAVRGPATLFPGGPGAGPQPCALPPWADGVAPLHEALAEHAASRARGAAQWCSAAEADLWAAVHLPLVGGERLGLLRDAPRGLFKRRPAGGWKKRPARKKK